MGCGKSKQAAATADTVTKSNSRSASRNNRRSGVDHQDKYDGGGTTTTPRTEPQPSPTSTIPRTEAQQPSPTSTIPRTEAQQPSPATATTTTETTTTEADEGKNEEIITESPDHGVTMEKNQSAREEKISNPSSQVINITSKHLAENENTPAAGKEKQAADVTVAVIPEVSKGGEVAVTTAVMVMAGGGDGKSEMRTEEDEILENAEGDKKISKNNPRHDRTVSRESQATSEYYSEVDTDDQDDEETATAEERREEVVKREDGSSGVSDVEKRINEEDQKKKVVKVEDLQDRGAGGDNLVKEETTSNIGLPAPVVKEETSIKDEKESGDEEKTMQEKEEIITVPKTVVMGTPDEDEARAVASQVVAAVATEAAAASTVLEGDSKSFEDSKPKEGNAAAAAESSSSSDKAN